MVLWPLTIVPRISVFDSWLAPQYSPACFYFRPLLPKAEALDSPLLAFSWPEEAELTTFVAAPESLRMRRMRNAAPAVAVGGTINGAQEAILEILDDR